MDLEAWLGALGLERYVGAFRDNDIDGDVLGEELDRTLAVHIGIASGEVVVAGQGAENPEYVPDYAVTGVAANLAIEMKRLRDEAARVGLMLTVPAFEAALGDL